MTFVILWLVAGYVSWNVAHMWRLWNGYRQLARRRETTLLSIFKGLGFALLLGPFTLPVILRIKK